VLREAASQAIPAALSAVRTQERTALAAFCRARIDLVTATPSDLSQLRAAVAPMLARLERNPQTRSFIASIEAMRETAGAAAEAALSCAPQAPPAASGLPDGTYTTRITPGDVRRSGLPRDMAGDIAQSHFTLVLKSGSFVLYQLHPSGQREIGIEGTYSLYRDRFVGTGSNGDVIRARWSFDGTNLRFADIEPKGPYYVVWGSEPWTRRSP